MEKFYTLTHHCSEEALSYVPWKAVPAEVHKIVSLSVINAGYWFCPVKVDSLNFIVLSPRYFLFNLFKQHKKGRRWEPRKRKQEATVNNNKHLLGHPCCIPSGSGSSIGSAISFCLGRGRDVAMVKEGIPIMARYYIKHVLIYYLRMHNKIISLLLSAFLG